MSKTSWGLIGVACAGLVRLAVIAFLGVVALLWAIEGIDYLVQLTAGTLKIY